MPATRQGQLLARLRKHGPVTVTEPVALLEVWRDTGCGDLDALETRGVLVRT